MEEEAHTTTSETPRRKHTAGPKRGERGKLTATFDENDQRGFYEDDQRGLICRRGNRHRLDPRRGGSSLDTPEHVYRRTRGSGEELRQFPRCQATSKTTGEQCGAVAVKGERHCRYHRAYEVSGSTYLKRHVPTNLLATYERSLSDPTLLSLREDIALLDAQINQFLAGMEDKTWKRARIRECMRMIEQRRKLVKDERDYELRSKAMLTDEQATALIAWLAHVIQQHVSDPVALKPIHQQFAQDLANCGRSLPALSAP